MNVISGLTNDRAALASAVRPALNGSAAELAGASGNVLNEIDYSFTGGPGKASLASWMGGSGRKTAAARPRKGGK